jgi:hypothetical protein
MRAMWKWVRPNSGLSSQINSVQKPSHDSLCEIQMNVQMFGFGMERFKIVDRKWSSLQLLSQERDEPSTRGIISRSEIKEDLSPLNRITINHDILAIPNPHPHPTTPLLISSIPSNLSLYKLNPRLSVLHVSRIIHLLRHPIPTRSIDNPRLSRSPRRNSPSLGTPN